MKSHALINYICKKCDGLETETSICPVCGNRTELISSEIYYCEKCNAPSFTKECCECRSTCKKIGTDIRPVFAKERLLLEVFLKKPMALQENLCGQPQILFIVLMAKE